MATTTRPFTTAPTPTTAREAHALAAVLAEQESALAKAQREARSAAAFTAAEEILATDGVEAATDRDEAVTAWQAAAADPSASLDELLSAFVRMREASATRAAIVGQAAGVMNQVRPKRNPLSGQPDTWRYDTADSLALAQFGDALELVIKNRADHAAAVARDSVQARATDAGEQAAAQAKA